MSTRTVLIESRTVKLDSAGIAGPDSRRAATTSWQLKVCVANNSVKLTCREMSRAIG